MNITTKTKNSNLHAGVGQGCILSPFPIIMVVMWMLKEIAQGKENENMCSFSCRSIALRC